MKNKVSMFFLVLAVFSSIISCRKEEERDFENRLYINMSSSVEELVFKQTTEVAVETRTLKLSTPMPVNEQVVADLEYDKDYVDLYNRSYGENAVALPEEMVQIDKPQLVISESTTDSDEATITFTGIEKLSRDQVYVVPVRLKNVQGIDVLDSKSLIYYVFRAGALINVVPDVAKNFFQVKKWNNDVSNLKVLTVEALINVRNFSAIQEKGEAITTIFGVEDHFLVRVGDTSIEPNQIQIVSPNGGKFPSRNADYGLPENKWVHVAVVWDADTRERIIYHNGVEIVSDNGASGSVNLNGNKDFPCYIGKSFNDNRWIDGCISELRVWNTHRTQEQIAANIYSVNPESEGLIAYWKFDEGVGNKIKDHSVNGNNIEANSDLKWVKVSLPE